MTIKNKLSKLFTTVGAGVVGSVLTLTVVTNASFIPNNDSLKSEPIQTADSQPYTLKQTSSNQLSLADMVENSSKSIVGIVNIQNQTNPFLAESENVPTGSGSGVIFKKDGNNAYIITNNHVIEKAQEIEVSLESGEKTTAELVGADALTDLAVLKIDSKYVEDVLPIGDSDSLRAGDQVVAIGNPLGLEFSRTVTQGIVSAVNRSINVDTSAGKWDLQVIQTDAAINPGNSGGALINSSGELVGINSLKISERGVEGLGFAIPSNDAMPIIEEMIKHGKIERPHLGVSLAELEEIPQQYLQNIPDEVEGGVMVVGIEPESAAARAGIKVEDVIVSVNGTDVESSSELRKVLYSDIKIGDKVELKVYRDGKQLTIDVSLQNGESL